MTTPHPSPPRTASAPPEMALAEALATRLCHDLAGLCGTLLNALELAVEDHGAAAEALPLAHEMAATLAARLRLLRAAWGAPGEALDGAALAALGAGLPGAPRVALDLSGMAADTTLPPVAARVVLAALLLGAEALPGGGTLALSGDARALTLAITGRRAAWPAALPGLLAAPEHAAAALREAGPRGLQAPLLAMMARAAGCALHFAGAAADLAAPLRIALAPA